jgi:radical SAM superfamily enzyme YgiQ (UPF0313 family)
MKSEYPQDLDALFIHIPRTTGEINEIMAMPMGIIPIAAHCEDAGYKVQIVHEGIEKSLNPEFDIIPYISAADPRIIFIDLFWTKQIQPVFDYVKRIKRAFPGLPIVMGGFTATFFFKEILNRFPEVDFIIRGDGEEPAKALLRYIADQDISLEPIPNLAWKYKHQIMMNEMSFHASSMIPEKSDHARFSLLSNYTEYIHRCIYADFDLSKKNAETHRYDRTFFYNPGRGCPLSCTYCGGTWWSRNIIEDSCFFYPQEKVFRDIRTAYDYGCRSLRISFDPDRNRKYYLEIFDSLKDLNLRLIFDCFFLPDEKFAESLKNNFSSDSILVISPECGNEEIRKLNRGNFFSNSMLKKSLKMIDSMNIATHLFFSAGLARETTEHVGETAELIRWVKENINAAVTVFPQEIDPGSFLFLDPQKYGLKLRLRKLRDFLEEPYRFPPLPGYETDSMRESEISDAIQYLSELVK